MMSFGGKSGPNQPPATWYPDPHRRAELRYWDGVQWTSFVSTGGSTSDERAAVPAAGMPPSATPPPMAFPPMSSPPPMAAPSRPPFVPGKKHFIGFLVVFAFVVVLLGVSALRFMG